MHLNHFKTIIGGFLSILPSSDPLNAVTIRFHNSLRLYNNIFFNALISFRLLNLVGNAYIRIQNLLQRKI